MGALFDYFDKTSIIHLPERTDRLRTMQRELFRIGFDFHSAKIAIPDAPRPADANGFASKAVYGNFLSHLTILEDAHASGLQNILIMEDDAIFRSSFDRQQRTIVEALRNNRWDMLLVGHSYKGELPKSTSGLVRFSGSCLWAHCYAVHRRLMPRLIEYLHQVIEKEAGKGGKMYVDGALSEFRMQHSDDIYLATSPCLSVQRGSPSSIGTNAHWYDSQQFLKRAVTLGRATRDQLWRLGLISMGPSKAQMKWNTIQDASPWPEST